MPRLQRRCGTSIPCTASPSGLTFEAECGERFETNEKAEAKTFDYIEVFYNRQRRHSALGYVSPAEHERAVQAELVA